jgi:hypothetical protein
MKILLILLALTSQIALADNCQMRQASKMIAERQVGNIDDLVKEKSYQKCRVKFSIEIDSEKHNVDWTHQDYGDPEISCQKAIENGMSELYMRLGGKFQTEVMTVCKEGQPKEYRPFRKGDQGLENEFGYVAEQKKYFTHNGTKCRFFRERYNNGQLRIAKGVICQTDNELWTVVDKY